MSYWIRSLICLFITLSVLPAFSSTPDEDGQIEIFLLTCGPGTPSFLSFGHSALRVIDPQAKPDMVYNYGTFDFDAPNFIGKFVKGRLDYFLSKRPHKQFIRSYAREQRWINQTKFNLTNTEAQSVLEYLEKNYKPENRVYRYDFLSDNCSSRISDIFLDLWGNKFNYPEKINKSKRTYREAITH